MAKSLKQLKTIFFTTAILFSALSLVAQKVDSTQRVPVKKDAEGTRDASWLIYARMIRDTHGNIRIDENIVPRFRMNAWLYVEPGIRIGETKTGSYAHYKIELGTKSFWRIVRIFARMSDNIIAYESPHFRRTNYLTVAESIWPLSRSFSITAAVGQVYSRQVDNSLEGWPSLSRGTHNNYWVYKAAVRYHVQARSALEVALGSYDVFNPYLPESPFLQASFDYDITGTAALYSYFRYQYNQYVRQPANDFLGIGVRLHPNQAVSR